MKEANFDDYLDRETERHFNGDDSCNSNCCGAPIDEYNFCTECGEKCVSIQDVKDDYNKDLWDRR